MLKHWIAGDGMMAKGPCCDMCIYMHPFHSSSVVAQIQSPTATRPARAADAPGPCLPSANATISKIPATSLAAHTNDMMGMIHAPRLITAASVLSTK